MHRVTGFCCAIVAAIVLGGCGKLQLMSWGEQPPAARRTNEVRVMSFNIRQSTIADMGNTWGMRKGLLVQTVRNFDPDLLGTQEAEAGQSDYLCKQLPEYGFVGAGRSNGARGGEMCGVFYKSAKFTKLDEGHFWLSEKPEDPGSKGWGAWFPRMVTWVKLQPKAGGETFYYFNTHLDAFNSKARLEGSKLLRSRIERIARGSPVVLTGDFNTDEGTEPYAVLTTPRTGFGGVTLVDTLRTIRPIARADDGTRHGFHGGRGGDRIDWILASPELQPVAAAIDHSRKGNRYPSDHFPVTAVLRWRPSFVSAQRQANGG